ncbi:hypothetical protein AX17_007019 [Amanita inopinata Kibby_2008]|nr:hypothetical protein AX17_007019 [Amanita inopinata Kibby_2008]
MLVRLPAKMPNVVVDLSTLPSSFTLPSNSTILLSLFTALAFLLLVHAAYVVLHAYILRAKGRFDVKRVLLVVPGQGTSSPSSQPSQVQSEKVERAQVTASALEQQTRTPSATQGKWNTGLHKWFRWDNLQVALPVSLTLPRSEVMKGRSIGMGIGVSSIGTMSAPPRADDDKTQQQTLQQPSLQVWQQTRRAGPAFESPLPAMYQTDVPASMAKMIMSRHTYRKPAQRPPPRTTSTIPPMQISRRPSPV